MAQDQTRDPVDPAEGLRATQRKREAARLKRLAHDPNVFVLALGGGRVHYEPMGALNNAFRIHVQSRTWEHTGDDALGRWIYQLVR